MGTTTESMIQAAHQELRCAYASNGTERTRLQRHLKSGIICMPFPRFYADPQYWNALSIRDRLLHILRTDAHRHRRQKGWTYCGPSAAVVWGLTDSTTLCSDIHVVRHTHCKNRDSSRIRFHQRKDYSSVEHEGIPVTSLTETVFDCARLLQYPEALAIVDKSLQLYAADIAQARDHLRQYFSQRTGKYGGGRAIIVLHHADPSSANGGESIARGYMIQWGFLPPDLQRRFADPVKGGAMYADYCWTADDGNLIVAELDGRQKYVDVQMLNGRDTVDKVLEEKNRDGNLYLAGVHTVVHFTMNDVYDGTLRRKLELAGVPRNPDYPRIASLIGGR